MSESPEETEPTTLSAVGVGYPSALQALAARQGRDVDPQIELDPERTRAAELPAVSVNATNEPQSRYEITGEIGRGGIGVVVRARDRDLRRAVAMKMLLPRSRGGAGAGQHAQPLGVEARFLEEAQITAQLSHPGVVPVHELGIGPDGNAFFTMAIVRGQTLGGAFAAARRGEDGWTQARVLGALQRVCETVGYAHDRGVVHRDLKPANIMVGRFGEVYVMDWGLARVRGRADTRDLRPEEPPRTVIDSDRAADEGEALRTLDGTVLGTPAYMSPEQATGRQADIGPRTDVYAIGAMLYELLAGHPPYLATGSRIPAYVLLACVVMGPPPSLEQEAPDAPEELRRIAARAMSRNMMDRQESAAALGADIQGYLDGIERSRRDAEARELIAAQAQSRSEAVLSLVLDQVREPIEQLGRMDAVRGVADAVRKYLDDSETTSLGPRSAALRAAVMRWLADVEAKIGTSERETKWAHRAAELAAMVPEDEAEFRRERIRILLAQSHALWRVGDDAASLVAANDALARVEMEQLRGTDDDLLRLQFAVREWLWTRDEAGRTWDGVPAPVAAARDALERIAAPRWEDRLNLAELIIRASFAAAPATDGYVDAWMQQGARLLEILETERPGTWQIIRLSGELKLASGLRQAKRGNARDAIAEHTVGATLVRRVEAMDTTNPQRMRLSAGALSLLAAALCRSQPGNPVAMAHFTEALRQRRALVASDPGDRQFLSDLVQCLGEFGYALTRGSTPEAGLALINEGIQIATDGGLTKQLYALSYTIEKRALYSPRVPPDSEDHACSEKPEA